MSEPTLKELRAKAWSELKSIESDLQAMVRIYKPIFDRMERNETIAIDKVTFGYLMATVSIVLGDICNPELPDESSVPLVPSKEEPSIT